MIIRNLKLRNFRNLQSNLSLSNGINVVIAPNGSGKTNLLEAIYFLASGKSYRTSQELDTIKNDLLSPGGTAYTRIEGTLMDSLGNEVILEVFIEMVENNSLPRAKKGLKVNKNSRRRLDFIGNLYSVIFSPKTVDLVAGSPYVRRRDLDDYLSMKDADYLRNLYEYNNIVRNRNRLLQFIAENKAKKQELDFWNDKLIDSGSLVIFHRVDFFRKVNPLVQKLALKVFNGEDISLSFSYDSKFLSDGSLGGICDSFRNKVRYNTIKEIAAGRTLYGPHREDFHMIYQNKDLREFGSRGQQRLAAFLYKIIQWQLLYKEINYPPILLLDDLLSELDPQVCLKVQKFLRGIGSQILLTGLNKDTFENNFLREASMIKL